MPRLIVLLAAASAAVCTATVGPAAAAHAPIDAPAGVLSAYALAAPRSESASGLVARAVVPRGAACPALTVQAPRDPARRLAMAVRPAPADTSPAFEAITVCSRAIPAGMARASIAGTAVPAHLPTRVRRLALLGDSGCRIASWQVQDCASESAWPLGRLAQSMVADRPDAILFNGDFFYREAPCPPTAEDQCGSSPPPVAGLPFTDSAYGWMADVLVPLAPVLSAAPLIVARGNHEACYRGGNGYFLLLDPREGTQDTCAPVRTDKGLKAAPTLPTATYALDLPVSPGRTLRLAIVDSAGGSDTQVTTYADAQRPAYATAARLTARQPGRESWLMTHRPLYGYVTDQFATPGVPFNPWTSLDQSAAAYGLLDTYDLVFGSHAHIAQAVQLTGLPPQLVLGNAGTLLDPASGYPLPTQPLDVGDGRAYPSPRWAWVAVRFGYAIAQPGAAPGQWRLSMHDPQGRQFARCGLSDRQLYCR
ncbi:MAG: hypothetical protein GC156_14135 [Actinomycetales bacterium]|nr:hypothetical protein [Actinomycetales bacterium]